jgi:hypothetical protein
MSSIFFAALSEFWCGTFFFTRVRVNRLMTLLTHQETKRLLRTVDTFLETRLASETLGFTQIDHVDGRTFSSTVCFTAVGKRLGMYPVIDRIHSSFS